MPTEVKMNPAGLHTAPANLDAPPGGLLEADNVVIRNQGLAEPRPGFTKAATTSASYSRAFPYNGDVLQVDLVTPKTRFAGNSAHVVDEGATDLQWAASAIQGVQTRSNLYLTTSDVVRKLSSKNDTVAYQTGAPTPAFYLVYATVAGTAVTAGSYVAVRFVTRRTDAQGVVVRSAPSGRATAQATAGSSRDVSMTIVLHRGTGNTGFRAGDVIEAYRTLDQTVSTPTDDLYLSKEYALTAADVTAGYVVLVDSNPQNTLGASLYTNAAEEGLAYAHVRPPSAACAEWYNGSLWLGNLKYPAQQEFSFPYTNAKTASNDHVGQSSSSFTFTGGSPTAVVANSALFKVGQIYASSIGDFATITDYVRVTALPDGTHVTFSANWNLANGTYTRKVVDSLKIGTKYYPIDSPADLVAAIRGYVSSITPPTPTPPADTSVTADALSDDLSAISFNTYNAAITLTCFLPTTTPPQIWATNGALYSPALPEPTVGTGYTLPQEIIPSGVTWSNDREPEHFNAVDGERIGAEGCRVLAMKRCKNSLLIFTDKGIVRGSGFAESGVRFDMLDETVRLLYPEACAALGHKVYAWSDAGVYECDENGCVQISKDALAELDPIQKAIGPGSTTMSGCFMVANPKDNEFVLGVPPPGGQANAAALYVYNQRSQAWTRWFSTLSMNYGYRTAAGLLVIGTSGFEYSEKVRDDSDPGNLADNAYTINVVSLTGSDYVITAGSGWTPAVGDMVYNNGNGGVSLVTAVTNSTHFSVVGALDATVTKACSAYLCQITPIACAAQDPGKLKLWGEGAIWFASRQGLYQVVLGFRSPTALAGTESDQTIKLAANIITNSGATDTAEALRFTVPRSHARTTRLYPTLKITQAGSRWKLEALAVKHRIMGDRVRVKFS